MVTTLLALKFRLIITEIRRSIARLVVYIIFGLNALWMLVLLLMGLIAASLVVEGNEALVGAITVIVGSAIVIGWTLLPLLFFGFDQTLDPSRFVLFPLTGRKLAFGLVLAGIIGIPGLLTALVALGSALPWIQTPYVLLIGLVGGTLGFLTTQVFCRMASTALSGSLSSRKVQDLTGLISLVVILVLSMSGYLVSMAFSLLSESPDGLGSLVSASVRISSVLAWTPFGAPWSLAADAALGQWWLMIGHLAVSVVYLALGLWLYTVVLSKALVTPARSGPSAIEKHDSIARAGGWIWANGPLVPVAAIAARCFRYWRRDPRYLGQIPAVLLLFVLFVVMGITLPTLISEDGTTVAASFGTGMIGFGLGLTALMTGYTLSADVSYDASAWWIHLTTGIKGWHDRLGRIIAQAAWAAPLLLLGGIAVPLIVGGSTRIPAIIGAMFAFYLTAVATSSIFSALFIYPVALPGESPLKVKTGQMGLQMLSQFGCLALGGLLGLPIAIWAIFATGWQIWLVLIVGLLWGVAVLTAGVFFGGKIMDSRGAAILQSLIKNDSRERS